MLGAGFDFNVACHVRLLSKDGVVGGFRCCRGEAAGKDKVKWNGKGCGAGA
jgi:CxxC motif-containing protein